MRRNIGRISALVLGLTLGVAGNARAANWRSIGPYGQAQLSAWAASPSSPSIVYAATPYGSVQVSRDGGRSWRQALGGILDRVDMLAVDPRQPLAVFAATSGGIRRSLDGGATWTRCPVSPSTPTVPAVVAIDPRRPSILFAGGANGLYRSADGCATWRRLTGLPGGVQIRSVAIDPFVPSRVYVNAIQGGERTGRNGVYGSTDGGATWSRLLVSLEGTLLADPAVPQTVYLATREGLFRSVNGGRSWQRLLNLELAPWHLAVVAGTPRQICVVTASSTLYCSRDQGRSFQPVSGVGSVLSVLPTRPGEILAATFDAEILRSADGGLTWQESARGYISTTVKALAAGPGYLLAGAHEGLFRSSDGGATWSDMRAGNQPTTGAPIVTALAVDPKNPDNAYAVLFGSVDGPPFWKSTDGGLRWRSVEVGPLFLSGSALAIDPRSPSTLYAGSIAGDGGVWKSTDAGETWQRLPIDFLSIYKIVVSPDDGAVYAAGHLGIERSRDGGATWQRVRPVELTFTLPLAISPSDPHVLYTQGWRSRDGGDTWEAMPDPFGGINAPGDLVVDPRDPGTVYAATQLGVRRWTGAGPWTRFGSGLISPGATTVFIHPEQQDHLLCGTTGTGAYELLLGTP